MDSLGTLLILIGFFGYMLSLLIIGLAILNMILVKFKIHITLVNKILGSRMINNKKKKAALTMGSLVILLAGAGLSPDLETADVKDAAAASDEAVVSSTE